MKLIQVAVVLVASIVSTQAFAALITSTYTPDADVCLSATGQACTGSYSSQQSITHTHDITDQYSPGTPISDATLTLYFRDDSSSSRDGVERAAVYGLDLASLFGIGTSTASGAIAAGSQAFDVGGLGLLQLLWSGALTYTLTATQGDFYFLGSTLDVDAATRAVPEPGTLALLGAGLIGLGLVRRRKHA